MSPTKESKSSKSSNQGRNTDSEIKSVDMEFGGTGGATFLIVWSHYILMYFW